MIKVQRERYYEMFPGNKGADDAGPDAFDYSVVMIRYQNHE